MLWTITAAAGLHGCPTHEDVKLDLGNGSSMLNYHCSCGFYEEGNPYLNGCQVVEACANCSGYCSRKYQGGFSCVGTQIIPIGKPMKVVVLGVGIGVGILLVAGSAFWLYKVVQKRKSKKQKEKLFKRNGGLLLQQQMSADEGAIQKSKLFRARELEKATDQFNENRILGRGGQGTVYKGMLPDGRIVAVKKSKLVDESQLEQFINEVVILSQINHRSVVKLLGCCLETEVPILVYEFVSNGTLFNYIQDKRNEFPTSLKMRLRIATEVAQALAYLHSATSVPIYHRDIKSTNILLDEKFRAKVSDFGTSRSIAVDQTHLTTFVKGTFGYLDPEYFQSSQFTEKSDVYSFGVVLVELLTGQKPIFATEMGEPTSLAAHFILSMEGTCLLEIIDYRVLEEGTEEQLAAVADLAKRCLNMNGKLRPTMKEVVLELEAIRTIQMPLTTDGNPEGDLTTMGLFDDISTSFEVKSLLFNSF